VWLEAQLRFWKKTRKSKQKRHWNRFTSTLVVCSLWPNWEMPFTPSTEIVVDLAKKLNQKVNFPDLSIAHRLSDKKRKQNGVIQPTTIVAQFTNKCVRNSIYTNRKLAKSFTEFPIPDIIGYSSTRTSLIIQKKLLWSTKGEA